MEADESHDLHMKRIRHFSIQFSTLTYILCHIWIAWILEANNTTVTTFHPASILLYRGEVSSAMQR